MKIAVFSDVHDNLTRWQEADKIIKDHKIEVGICCGDVTSRETLEELAKSFKKLYLAFGNGDWQIAQNPKKVPSNVFAFEKFGGFEIEDKKIAAVHNDQVARSIAGSGIYDVVFYGHTHTPWESKKSRTISLNPGEVAGHYGPASFCIYDLSKMSGQLYLLD